MCILHNTHTYIILGDLCDNIGLVGVSAMWSYVTTSTSHHDQAIPILSPLIFMHVGHPYIPLFKILKIFDLLVIYIITSPFVYRDVTGWPASLPYICKICFSVAIGTQSGIRLHKMVPMVKIWGSSKNYQNRTTGKLLTL